jgi:hypothetical protein
VEKESRIGKLLPSFAIKKRLADGFRIGFGHFSPAEIRKKAHDRQKKQYQTETLTKRSAHPYPAVKAGCQQRVHQCQHDRQKRILIGRPFMTKVFDLNLWPG